MRLFPKSPRNRALAAIAALIAICGILAFLFPQQVLCVDSGEVHADALVVLGGGSYERPKQAAELFRAGAAPWIIVTGFGDYSHNRKMLIAAGVPEAAIQVEPMASSTRENALFSIPLLRAMAAGKAEMLKAEMLKSDSRDGNTAKPQHRTTVILVTSWYHSRRALHTFQHYAPDIQFYSRPAYFGYPRKAQGAGREAQGAERKAVRGYIRAEYLKMAGYWVCYGVWPF